MKNIKQLLVPCILAATVSVVEASTINAEWVYNAETGALSITADQPFAYGAPTFETWVDNQPGPGTSYFKNIGQAGGASVVELSNDNYTASIKSNWMTHFKLDTNEESIIIKVYNANNSLSNLLDLSNNQGLAVITNALEYGTSSSMIGGTRLPDPVSAVPVPAAAWLFGSAIMGLGLVRRK